MELGPYRLVRELDAGVATTVWLAEHTSLPRRAVVKRLRETVSPDSSYGRALAAEARALSQLSHSGVVALYELRETRDGVALVLEHVDGTRLDVIAKEGRLAASSAAIACVGAALAAALAHVHERGLVHRDVKPGNVLLTASGEVKLFDFGAAAPVGEHGARASAAGDGLAFGTPAYLAPEQVLGAEAAPASDVFSFGVVLFELATARRPFGAHGAVGPAPPLAQQVPGIDARLAGLVDRCLSIAPAERPSAREAHDVLAALGREGGHDALTKLLRGAAPPPPALVTPTRGVRRWPLGLAALLGVVVAVALASVVGRRESRAAPVAAATGALRVLADPWAEVWVDGAHVATTPFARPLALSAGPHAVVLKHPDARDVRRDVEVRAGVEHLVTVTMDVPSAVEDGGSAAGDDGGPRDDAALTAAATGGDR